MNLFKWKKRPLVVMIHGFGTRLSREFDLLNEFLESHHYQTLRFNIYDLDDENDADWHDWIVRCEAKMKEAFAINQDVVLLGFSMGGVIASYLATIYPVKQLILVAPAFQFLDYDKIQSASISMIKSVITRDKEKSKPSSQQTRCFMDIISNLKDSIDHVTCPILILHGLEDEVIQYKSSTRIYERIAHKRKHLILIADGKHRMLYDGNLEPVPFQLILDMLEDKFMLN